MILALDLSSSTIGYSIFEESELVKIGYFKYTSSEMLKKAFELEKFLDDLFRDYSITDVCIEESLKAFREGGTNAEAMFKTTKLNFLCQFLVSKKGLKINELNVNNARSLAFPNFHKFARTVKGVPHKEIIFKFVLKELGEDFFPKKIISRGANKGEEVYLEEARDMADSFIIGKAFIKKSKA